MPSDQENVQYLYLVLTNGGAPSIDWDAVGKAMDLKKGAVSKRWSRLKKAMDAGDPPGPSVYKFLWLCVKHSTRDKAMNWNEIAKQCNTTACAASKRYSRMKQAFEADAAPPGSNSASPAPGTPSKATPRKRKTLTTADSSTPTPKRKRATPKKKAVGNEEDSNEDLYPKPMVVHDEESEDMHTSRHTRAAEFSAIPETNVTIKKETTMFAPAFSTIDFNEGKIEGNVEGTSEDGFNFFDAKEWVNELADGSTIADDEDQADREESPRFI